MLFTKTNNAVYENEQCSNPNRPLDLMAGGGCYADTLSADPSTEANQWKSVA
jgi:hypothetical protein